jgi:hypothetical protein
MLERFQRELLVVSPPPPERQWRQNPLLGHPWSDPSGVGSLGELCQVRCRTRQAEPSGAAAALLHARACRLLTRRPGSASA